MSAGRRHLGLVLLTVRSGLDLVLAVVLVVAMALCGRHAPALSLVFSDAQIRALEPRVLGVVALAILGNGAAGLGLTRIRGPKVVSPGEWSDSPGLPN